MTHQRTSSEEKPEYPMLTPGRLPAREPIAVIDIGSNSVRQVVYEGMTRALSVLFNEKVLCGLGNGIAKRGSLDEQAVERAIGAIRRFVQLGSQLGVKETHILATAAAREATNGPQFIAQVEKITASKVKVLTGAMEAEYAAWGVKSGYYKPDGIVGDLGGGSLELVHCNGDISQGITLPLGGLRLRDMSGGSLEIAKQIVTEHLRPIADRDDLNDKVFYAVGGTWRSLAKLHLVHENYPLFVLHDYRLKAGAMMDFCTSISNGDVASLAGISSISKNRRELLTYGALVMSELIRVTRVEEVSVSSLGLREGYLHSLLPIEERDKDPLLEASWELCLLRSRSPQHSQELADWTGDAFKTLGIGETEDEARYRIASCYLADIAWRAHSDYQAEQSRGIIANAGFSGIDHAGRAYLTVANYCRYTGLGNANKLPQVAKLAPQRFIARARLLAALMRVLYLFSASGAGTIPQLRLSKQDDGTFELCIPAEMANLVGERPRKRLQQLAAEHGSEIKLVVGQQVLQP